MALLSLDAVVGIKANFDADGRLTRLGITCALCHSSVDDSVGPGIGRRMDGWASVDLHRALRVQRRVSTTKSRVAA